MIKIKRIVVFSLICALFISTTTFASTLQISAQDIENGLIDVNPEDIPEGVIPVKYDSLNEAIKYIQENIKSRKNIFEDRLLLPSLTRATNANLLVDEHDVTVGKVKLYINYGTSGDSSTGTITYVSPYTVFEGFSMGYDWVEKSIGYNIASNKKDVYVYASGQLDYYVIVNGGIKVWSEHINLGRTCYLAR